jgi:hypothetical protein
MINNNTNALEYTTFNENSQFTHSVRSNYDVINTINVTVFDLMGNSLVNLGEWVFVLRFVRKRPTKPEFRQQELGFY